ncbi:MAG TPA: cyclic pyranopterin monophosphate synthase MoaC, partial [Lentisphaerae bacterium]|nr:cyclic pyranopterin monophosphate synthase MoaC [Lentisphaerota bacterium]
MSMVDVSGKDVVFRKARARACVELPRELLARVSAGELTGPKGPVFQTAVLAGTLAAKETSRLIPY